MCFFSKTMINFEQNLLAAFLSPLISLTYNAAISWSQHSMINPLSKYGRYGEGKYIMKIVIVMLIISLWIILHLPTSFCECSVWMQILFCVSKKYEALIVKNIHPHYTSFYIRIFMCYSREGMQEIIIVRSMQVISFIYMIYFSQAGKCFLFNKSV